VKLVSKYFEKDFVGSTGKDAYLKASKWVARFIISKVEIGETFWSIVKVESDSPTFRLQLFSAIEEKEHRTSFCDKCKEFHKAFYINQQYNCDACNLTAYQQNMEKRLQVKSVYREERLRYIMEKN
jgi:hypothetical protein